MTTPLPQPPVRVPPNPAIAKAQTNAAQATQMMRGRPFKKGGGVKKYAKGGLSTMRGAPNKPMKPYPSESAEDNNVPQQVLDEAQRQLKIGKAEAAAGKKRGGKVKKRMKRGGRC